MTGKPHYVLASEQWTSVFDQFDLYWSDVYQAAIRCLTSHLPLSVQCPSISVNGGPGIAAHTTEGQADTSTSYTQTTKHTDGYHLTCLF